MSRSIAGLVRRSPRCLRADQSRVVAQLFVPGLEGFDQQESRSSAVLERVLALDDGEVKAAFDDVVVRFEDRHHHLLETFSRHAEELADRIDPGCDLSQTRRLLLGAAFTSEYAIEGAALCNPSMVVHPDQGDVAEASLRFVMSVRGIGEGHRSSVGFRTGVIDADGEVRVDAPPRYATVGQKESALLDVAVFRGELHRLHGGGEDADYVLDPLGVHFTEDELERRLRQLEGQLATRKQGRRAISLIRKIADRTYTTRFADDRPLGEQVLMPAMSAESNGMEDARFVRFEEDDGEVTYYATYTAYDGADIGQQLLETKDFRSFMSSPVVGPAAANKGLALFPRRIGGQYMALSRSDRETNMVASSDNLRHWKVAAPCQVPARSWEVLQLGNCGSPLETEAGWLVLTHGVGPMRTYSIGALLLDLDDPTCIVGQLREPLLSPAPDEQDGYVPNVVYSCGALQHADRLVLPYGIGDAAIGIATVPMADLLAALLSADH